MESNMAFFLDSCSFSSTLNPSGRPGTVHGFGNSLSQSQKSFSRVFLNSLVLKRMR